MELLFLNLLGGLVYNLLFIIFGIIAVIRASENKSYYGWIVAGCMIQAVPFFGAYLEYKSGSVRTELDIYGFIIFLLLLIAFLVWANSNKKNAIEKAAKGEDYDAKKRYIMFCPGCGSTYSELNKNLYVPHDCPNCKSKLQPTDMSNVTWNSLGMIEMDQIREKWRREYGSDNTVKTHSNTENVELKSTAEVSISPAALHHSKKIICPTCGKQLEPVYNYCNRCGRSIASVIKNEIAVPSISKLEKVADRAVNMDQSYALESREDFEDNKLVENNNLGSPAENPVFQLLDLSQLVPSLRRAYIFIEDEDWERANEYLEKVLDEEPENAYAYLGKALIDIKVDSPKKISEADIAQLKDNRNFHRACKYATGELKDVLSRWQH